MAQLRAALEGSGGEGRHYFDVGDVPAVYRIEPAGSEAMVALHPACPGNDGDGFVTVKLGSPRRELVTVPCSGCGAVLELHPPAEVVAFGRSGLVPAVIDLVRPN
jgi:hypothetical protein